MQLAISANFTVLGIIVRAIIAQFFYSKVGCIHLQLDHM